MNSNCPRLIEVALPIREISAESVRDKNIHHAHISHLHIWWARRPLAASRAIVFASLIPDPDHENCPEDFREAVIRLLKNEVPKELKGYWRGRVYHNDPDPYCPSGDLPDTPRNRLLAFIAKWSPEKNNYEKGKSDKSPSVGEVLDDRSLVKWETSDPLNVQGRMVLTIAEQLIKIANKGIPSVFDPFSGGGAIPLEAMRLGAKAIANDYNPVAFTLLKATIEYPKIHGVPGTRSTGISPTTQHFMQEKSVENVLTYDLEYWANWILSQASKRLSKYYPSGRDKRPIIGYLWARNAPCSNPACKTNIPLLKTFMIATKPDRRTALQMLITNGKISFEIIKGKQITQEEGTLVSNGVRCPFCHQITPTEDIKRATFEGTSGEQIVAVIVEAAKGKDYRAVELTDIEAFEKSRQEALGIEIPSEPMPNSPDTVAGRGWNFKRWGDLFNPRQLLVIQTFIEIMQEAVAKIQEQYEKDYAEALTVYLGLWIDRMASFSNNVCRWYGSAEISKTPFGGQAIPMMYDYPEVNPFADSSGTPSTQLRYMLGVIDHESTFGHRTFPMPKITCGDSSKIDLPTGSINVVVTDPPYFDAIAYADLSDFFYVWLKRSIGSHFPNEYMTPLTPKTGEATALKHHHEGNASKARDHFTEKLTECIKEARRVCSEDGILSIMFAHQSTEAWTALVNTLFEADLTITATYPIETEMKSTAFALDTASLESSITVVCRPRVKENVASFKNIRGEIEKTVTRNVKRFWSYGFRGADLIVACYGPAVGVFGRYERVEKADGSVVSITDLLDLVRELALKAIAGEFEGDGLSRLYFIWLNLYGVNEQSWDDARLVIQIGSEGEDAMEVARRNGLFVIEGPKCRLALLRDRSDHRHLGDDLTSPLIDQLHQAMLLWKQERRSELVQYLKTNNIAEHESFWKLAQALFEVLPRGEEDWKLISALLGERETLKQEVRQAEPPKGPEQLSLI